MVKRASSSNEQYKAFQDALRRVLQVSKSDLTKMLAEEKQTNTGKPKRGPKTSALGRASHDKG
jgi:hypothetical protein